MFNISAHADAVWTVLKQDEEVKESLAMKKVSDAQTKLAWFDVAIVHLGKPDEIDYIISRQGPMNGAHSTVFWVLLQRPLGIKLGLRVFADALDILSVRGNGYKKIDAAYFSGAGVTDMKYRFDGASYQMYSRRIENYYEGYASVKIALAQINPTVGDFTGNTAGNPRLHRARQGRRGSQFLSDLS